MVADDEGPLLGHVEGAVDGAVDLLVVVARVPAGVDVGVLGQLVLGQGPGEACGNELLGESVVQLLDVEDLDLVGGARFAGPVVKGEEYGFDLVLVLLED